MDRSKQKQFLIVGGVGIILLGIFISWLYAYINRNPYGDEVSLSNYSVVQNLPDSYEQLLSASIHKIVALNSGEKFSGSVKGVIRDGSAKQYPYLDNGFSGSFIVDIESVKQSYKVQYEYSGTKNDGDTSGYPILVSCLPVDQLKYGDFNCKNLIDITVSDDDKIIRLLPVTTLSYKIFADTSSGKLLVKVNLRIPSADLKGSQASRQRVVALYKSEVAQWFTTQKIDSSKYTILYDYDDLGNKVSF